jgi:hypothetical protein
MDKPIASLSLDLDNKWSYLKTYGDPGWESFPSYLDVLIPRVLDFLKARNLTITFFIVGQDAALEKHYDLFRAIAVDGHEIGNHSFGHEPGLHLYSANDIKTELAMAEEHIERATGQKPIGFRGPAYSLSTTIVHELARRGYHYDASTLPNLLEPVARSYYFMAAQFTPAQRRQRNVLGGMLRDGLRPITPYRWKVGTKTLVEIPVTTMPIFRIPIHTSYLLCLSLFSPTFTLQYFMTALRLCRLTGTEPSLILHPTDFLGCDDTKDLSFFPAMGISSERKMELVSKILGILSAEFNVLTLGQQAQRVAQKSNLPIVEPRFRTICQQKA